MKSKQSLFLIAARLLSMTVNVLSMRFFLHWFGESAYGAYAVGNGFFFFVALLDVGFFVGGARRITEAFHRGDVEEGWSIHRTQMTLGYVVALAGMIVYPLIGAAHEMVGLTRMQGVAFMEFLSWQFAGLWLVQYYCSALAAKNRFDLQGVLYFLVNFLGSAIALALGWHNRNMLWVSFGYGGGTLVGLLLGLIWVRIQEPGFRFRPGYDRAIARDLWRQGLTNYPNRVAGTFSNRSDRQIIYFYSPALTGQYQFISRPAEILTDLLGSTIDTTQPEVTRSAQQGPQEMASKLHRNCLVVWAMACSFMMVPCAFGSAIMHLWVPDKIFGSASLVMLCVALNYAGELHYRALGTAYVARGTLYRSVWFPAANGVATVLLTMPIVRAYGLAGIGIMNAVFSLVQLYPRIKHVGTETGGLFPVARHFSKSMGILGICGVLTWVGFEINLRSSSHWVILLAPVLACVAFAACVALRLAPPPKLLQRVWRRPIAVGA